MEQYLHGHTILNLDFNTSSEFCRNLYCYSLLILQRQKCRKKFNTIFLHNLFKKQTEQVKMIADVKNGTIPWSTIVPSPFSCCRKLKQGERSLINILLNKKGTAK